MYSQRTVSPARKSDWCIINRLRFTFDFELTDLSSTKQKLSKQLAGLVDELWCGAATSSPDTHSEALEFSVELMSQNISITLGYSAVAIAQGKRKTISQLCLTTDMT